MPLTPSELEPLIRLGLVMGVGPHRLARLVGRFGSADRVFSAGAVDLRAVSGIGQELVNRIRAATSIAARREASQAMDLLSRLGAIALTPDDPLYPTGFRLLADPPYLLFAAGNLALVEAPAIAIVGTRSPSPYGRRSARALSEELALAGFAIVSGMARGVDTAAHLGALDAAGMTIGVVGHGIDQVYPPESRDLFRVVRARGLLLTEYMPGETPKAGNFPRRNRLIAALAEAILVVEMGHASGAQHTVNYALEQGKEVFSVPGPIGVRSNAGTNQLIRDGAPLVTSAIDVLEALRGVGTLAPNRNQDSASGGKQRVTTSGPVGLPLLTDAEARILAALSVDPAPIDDVTSRTGIPSREALATLLELELRGLVATHPGKRFSLS